MTINPEYSRLYAVYTNLCSKRGDVPESLTDIKNNAIMDKLNEMIAGKMIPANKPMADIVDDHIKYPVLGDAWAFDGAPIMYVVGIHTKHLAVYHVASDLYFKISKGMFRELIRLIKRDTELSIACYALANSINDTPRKITITGYMDTYIQIQNKPGTTPYSSVVPEALEANLLCIKLSNGCHIGTYSSIV